MMVATTSAEAGVRLTAASTGLIAGASAERMPLSVGSALIAVSAAPAQHHPFQSKALESPAQEFWGGAKTREHEKSH